MGYIAWDTETSGRPPKNVDQVTPETYHLFSGCRMASIAAVQFSLHGREIESLHSIVYPDGYVLGSHSEDTQGATHIHKITHSHALCNGLPFIQVYKKFIDFIEKSRCTTLVAHNASFDKNVLFSECYRYGLSTKPFESLNFVCSLDMAKMSYLDTPDNKCQTLFKHITGEGFNAHDALEDSRACGVIYSIVRDIKFKCTPNGLDTININVSDVPSISGANWFKKPIDIAKIVISNYYSLTDRGIRRNDIVHRFQRESSVVYGIIVDALLFQSKRIRDVENKVKAVNVQLGLKTNLNDTKKTLICEYIRDTLYCKIGNKISNKKYYKHHICTIQGTKYVLTGYVDKLITDSQGKSVIVDVTDRTDSKYHGMTEVDRVRCQTLMQMLNVDECRFEEQRGDETHTEMYTRDDEKWNSVITPKLKRFCEYVHSRLSR
jgi:DNA polymerase III epsilon subunit-like protein